MHYAYVLVLTTPCDLNDIYDSGTDQYILTITTGPRHEQSHASVTHKDSDAKTDRTFHLFFYCLFFLFFLHTFFFLIGWQQRVFTYRKIPVTYKKKKVLDMELFWQNIQHEEHRNNGKSTMCGTTMIKVGDGGDGGGGVMSTVLHVSKGTIYFTGCALNYAVIYDRGQTRGSGLLGGGGKELT